MDSEYSFSLTTFSPSGKLVQIEYALNAVAAGSTSLAIKGLCFLQVILIFFWFFFFDFFWFIPPLPSYERSRRRNRKEDAIRINRWIFHFKGFPVDWQYRHGLLGNGSRCQSFDAQGEKTSKEMRGRLRRNFNRKKTIANFIPHVSKIEWKSIFWYLIPLPSPFLNNSGTTILQNLCRANSSEPTRQRNGKRDARIHTERVCA